MSVAYIFKRCNKFVIFNWRLVLNKPFMQLAAFTMTAAVTFTSFGIDA